MVTNKQLDISDIDKEEFDPNTEKYNFLENYPDPRVDKFYYKDKEHREIPKSGLSTLDLPLQK